MVSIRSILKMIAPRGWRDNLEYLPMALVKIFKILLHWSLTTGNPPRGYCHVYVTPCPQFVKCFN